MHAIVHLLMISTVVAAFDEPHLLQVMILIRSAERAPLREFTSAESVKLFPRGLGEVTDEGLHRASQQGAAFKQRYTELGLLKELSGQHPVWQGKPIVHTTEILKDEQALIFRNSMEHRCKVLARYNISHEFCDPDLLIAEFIKEYPDCSNFSYSRIESALAEIENPDAPHDSALAKCARWQGRHVQFRALSIRAAIGDGYETDRLRTQISPFISILSRMIDNAIRSELIDGMSMVATVRIYCTHDHVLLAVAHVLGILSVYKGRSPKFSSAIAIETWRTSEGFDIKIIVKDGLDRVFNQILVYRYHDLMKIMSPYTSMYQTNVQWDEHVKTVYTMQNFEKDESAISTIIMGVLWPKQLPTIVFEILLITLVIRTFVICVELKRN